MESLLSTKRSYLSFLSLTLLICIFVGCSGGGRDGLNPGGVEVRVSLQEEDGTPVPGAVVRVDDEKNGEADAFFEETDENGEAIVLAPENSAVIVSVATIDAIFETFDVVTGSSEAVALNLRVIEDSDGSKSIVKADEVPKSNSSGNQSGFEENTEADKGKGGGQNNPKPTPQEDPIDEPSPSVSPTTKPTPESRLIISGNISVGEGSPEQAIESLGILDISTFRLGLEARDDNYRRYDSPNAQGNFQLNISPREMPETVSNPDSLVTFRVFYQVNGADRQYSIDFSYREFRTGILKDGRLKFIFAQERFSATVPGVTSIKAEKYEGQTTQAPPGSGTVPDSGGIGNEKEVGSDKSDSSKEDTKRDS